MEIKEIKGYLGTKLQCYSIHEQETNGIEIIEGADIDGVVTNKGSLDYECCKLILRPLSDLTKEEFAVLFFDDESMWFEGGETPVQKAECLIKSGVPITDLCHDWKQWEWLYNNHFDIHNLIEKGEAININTLK